MVLGFAAMRLRPLTEAECYARCYGGHASERVTVVSLPARGTDERGAPGERLRRDLRSDGSGEQAAEAEAA
jgi:hypothetical protein